MIEEKLDIRLKLDFSRNVFTVILHCRSKIHNNKLIEFLENFEKVWKSKYNMNIKLSIKICFCLYTH